LFVNLARVSRTWFFTSSSLISTLGILLGLYFDLPLLTGLFAFALGATGFLTLLCLFLFLFGEVSPCFPAGLLVVFLTSKSILPITVGPVSFTTFVAIKFSSLLIFFTGSTFLTSVI